MKEHKKSLIEFVKPDFNFEDERGSLTQLFRNGWNQVNYISSEKGSVRGGHYHKKNSEMFFIISGDIKLTLKDIKSFNTEEYILTKGDMFVIRKDISHNFEFISQWQLITAYDNGVETDSGMDIHQG